jgi:hypothetical protein
MVLTTAPGVAAPRGHVFCSYPLIRLCLLSPSVTTSARSHELRRPCGLILTALDGGVECLFGIRMQPIFDIGRLKGSLTPRTDPRDR